MPKTACKSVRKWCIFPYLEISRPSEAVPWVAWNVVSAEMLGGVFHVAVLVAERYTPKNAVAAA